MSILTWYGHSAFKIQCGNASVLIDPFFWPATGLSAKDVGKVDLVLVSHDHGDHVGDTVSICKNTGAMLGAVVGTAESLRARGVPDKQIFNGIGFNIGGTLECAGIKATMTQAFHTSDSGAPVGYIITMPDNKVFYHAGDTGIFASMKLLGRLYPLDVALLPIGGVFTMDAYQAANACALLNCPAVVPMHWGTFPVLAQSTDQFRAQLAKVHPQCQCLDMKPGQAREI